MSFLKYKYVKDKSTIKNLLFNNDFVGFFLLNKLFSFDLNVIKNTILFSKCNFIFCKKKILNSIIPNFFLPNSFVKGHIVIIYSKIVISLEPFWQFFFNKDKEVFLRNAISFLFCFLFKKKLCFLNEYISIVSTINFYKKFLSYFLKMYIFLEYIYIFFSFLCKVKTSLRKI